MPKLTKTITGVADGEIYPRDFAEGEECPPGLEIYAASIGALAEPEAGGEECPPGNADLAEKKAAKKSPEPK